MAIIAFVSPKGSPGVTTTALACTLSWHSRVVLAECDPAGGSLMAGYLGGVLEGPRGIGELAVAELRDGLLEQDFWGQLVDLDAPKRQRLLLPGLANPAQAGSLTPLWGRFADFFGRLEQENPGFDVLADCGRLHVANPPWPILRAASAVLVVTSARLPDLSNAAATLETISRDLRDNGVPPGTVRLVVVGGGHSKGEISRALGVPVAAHLPIDRRTAQVLSFGGTVRGRRPLMRAAAALEVPVRSMVDRRRARSTWNTMAPAPTAPSGQHTATGPAMPAAPHPSGGHPASSGPLTSGGHPASSGPHPSGGHPMSSGPHSSGGHPMSSGPLTSGGHPTSAGVAAGGHTAPGGPHPAGDYAASSGHGGYATAFPPPPGPFGSPVAPHTGPLTTPVPPPGPFTPPPDPSAAPRFPEASGPTAHFAPPAAPGRSADSTPSASSGTAGAQGPVTAFGPSADSTPPASSRPSAASGSPAASGPPAPPGSPVNGGPQLNGGPRASRAPHAPGVPPTTAPGQSATTEELPRAV